MVLKNKVEGTCSYVMLNVYDVTKTAVNFIYFQRLRSKVQHCFSMKSLDETDSNET